MSEHTPEVDHAVEWCNSLTRSHERAIQRSQELGCKGDEYEDLLILRVALGCLIVEYRERVARRCAPWFEVRHA